VFKQCHFFASALTQYFE